MNTPDKIYVGTTDGEKWSIVGEGYPYAKEYIREDAVDDAKVDAMKDIAWKVHCLISEGKSIAEIDHYVCGICDF